MRRLNAVACLALALWPLLGARAAQSAATVTHVPRKAGAYTLSLSSGGMVRTAEVVVPPAISTGKRLPLLIGLHGGGGNGPKFASGTGLGALATTDGFIGVFPNGVDGHWNDGRSTSVLDTSVDDFAFLRALVTRLEKDLPVDASHIDATGISNGAMMSADIACRMSDVVTAVALVAGSLPSDDQATCSPSPISMMLIDGTADPLVPYNGGTVGKERGSVIGAEQTAEYVARIDGCSTTSPFISLPNRNLLDGSTVSQRAWTDCMSGSRVTLLRVNGGGHNWPSTTGPYRSLGHVNHDIDASTVIAAFFGL